MRGFLTAALCALALLIGCSYPGPPGPFDYWAAASPSDVVQISNGFVCRDQTSAPEPNAHGTCVDWGFIGCGNVPATDPMVAWDLTAGRWWYSVIASPLGGPSTVCLSSGVDPYTIDLAFQLPATAFDSTSLDRPQLAVSGNKVAVAINDPDHPRNPIRTLVMNKADLLAGVAPHTGLIKHSDFVTLATVIGADNPLAWVRPVTKGAYIGLITGVPGVTGGVVTAEVLVKGTNAGGDPATDAPLIVLPDGATMQEGNGTLVPSAAQAVVRDGRGAGMDLWLLTRTVRNGARELALARVGGLTPMFAPFLDSADAIGLPPAAAFFFTPSLGLDDLGNHALVGFTGGGAGLFPTPFLVGKDRGGALGATLVTAAGLPSGGRVDYAPTGAQFTVLTSHFVGVGWTGLGAIPTTTDGRVAVFFPFTE